MSVHSTTKDPFCQRRRAEKNLFSTRFHVVIIMRPKARDLRESPETITRRLPSPGGEQSVGSGAAGPSLGERVGGQDRQPSETAADRRSGTGSPPRDSGRRSGSDRHCSPDDAKGGSRSRREKRRGRHPQSQIRHSGCQTGVAHEDPARPPSGEPRSPGNELFRHQAGPSEPIRDRNGFRWLVFQKRAERMEERRRKQEQKRGAQVRVNSGSRVLKRVPRRSEAVFQGLLSPISPTFSLLATAAGRAGAGVTTPQLQEILVKDFRLPIVDREPVSKD